MREHHVSLPRGKVYVLDEGPLDAIPIVMVHGIPGTTKDFGHLTRHLAEENHYRLLRVDLPGFGQSPRGEWILLHLQAYVDMIFQVAETLALSPFILVGHSFGAGLSLVAAAQGKGRILAVCLVNGPGVRRHRGLMLPPTTYKLLFYGLKMPMFSRNIEKMMRRSYQKIGFLKYVDAPASELAIHLDWFSKINFCEIKKATKNLDIPALVITNGDDPLIESEISFDLVEALNSRITRHHLHLREGGHRIGAEKGRLIANSLAIFIGFI